MDLNSYILEGLDSSYGPFTTTFMIKNDDVTVDDLVNLLLQEEARLEEEHSHISTTVSESNSSTILVANRCLPRSSPVKTAFSPSSHNRYQDSRRKLQCQLCSKPGHEAIDCWHRTNQTTFCLDTLLPNDRSTMLHTTPHPLLLIRLGISTQAPPIMLLRI